MESYDRYTLFRSEGSIDIVPGITLDKKSSDYYEIYRAGHSRLDILSNKYYGNPSYGWIILMANPQFSSMEFEIPNNETIRIPYPLDDTLSEYIQKVKKYREEN